MSWCAEYRVVQMFLLMVDVSMPNASEYGIPFTGVGVGWCLQKLNESFPFSGRSKAVDKAQEDE